VVNKEFAEVLSQNLGGHGREFRMVLLSCAVAVQQEKGKSQHAVALAEPRAERDR
jgi:hypothetical protein